MRPIHLLVCATAWNAALSAAHAQSAPATQPMPESIELAGPLGTMVFSTAGGHLGLASLRDVRNREWAGPFPEKGSLWKIAITGPDGKSRELASGDWPLTAASGSGGTATFQWAPAPVEGKASVYLNINFGQRAPASWTLCVSPPSGWRVTRADCPIIPNIQAPAGTKMAANLGWGMEYDVKPGMNYEVTYPSLVGSSPFVAFYGTGSGIYLGTFDRAGRLKHFTVKTTKDTTSFACTQWPLATETVGGGPMYTCTSTGVYAGFEGNYWQAGQIYREVAAQAPWYPQQSIAMRPVPQWLKDIDLWLMPGAEPLKNVDMCKKAKDFFGVNIALHWYNWHEIPFDTLYPEYFPTKPSFKEGVKALQDAGLRVMPYINGRLCDPKSKTWIDEHADQSAARKEDGSVYTEVYGSKVPLNVMCPATRQWQEKIAGIVDRLVNECGVDGVYIDQIGAAAAVRCYATDHGHSPGGGDLWVTGYRKMLADIRAKLPKDRILTTEENAECWNDQLDALLMVNTPATSDRRIIPLMPTLYGDRIITFGFQYIAESDVPKSLPFRAKMARAFIYGAQLGWINVDAIMADNAKQEAEFLRNLARCRRFGHEFFVGGQFMGEVEVGGDNPRLKIEGGRPFADGGYAFEMPAVVASAWSLPGGPYRAAIAVVNLSNEPRRVELTLPASVQTPPNPSIAWLEGPAYGSQTSAQTVRMMNGGGRQAELTIPAREARFVDLKSQVK